MKRITLEEALASDWYLPNTNGGYCMCEWECGLLTAIAPKTDTKTGVLKGQPKRYRKGHQIKLGENHPGLGCRTSRGVGEKNPNYGKLGKDNPLFGRKHTQEALIKMSLAHKREKNPMWKGGTTLTNQSARDTLEYRQWRTKVFERDDYTCRHCGIRGGTLHPHHIMLFSIYKDLRYMVSNGLTLCKTCHREEHIRLDNA